jgi:hypothetical protein
MVSLYRYLSSGEGQSEIGSWPGWLGPTLARLGSYGESHLRNVKLCFHPVWKRRGYSRYGK